MAKLTPPQVALVANNAGFLGNELRIAVAVSFAEDPSHETTATGRVGEKGLWQIYPKAWPQYDSGGNLFDPEYNAQVAKAISSQGKRWNYWTTWPVQASARLLDASVAIAVMHSWSPGKTAEELVAIKAGGHTGFQPSLGNVPGAIKSTINPLSSIPETINRLGSWVTNPGNILRIVEVILGAAVIIAAISALSKPVTEPIVKTAVQTAKVVK